MGTVFNETPGYEVFCSNVGDGPITDMLIDNSILYALSGGVLFTVAKDCARIAAGDTD